MNRYLIFFLVLGIVSWLNAAEYSIDKGSMFLNGQFNFSHTQITIKDSETDKELKYASQLNISAQPCVGYFITKGLMIGTVGLFEGLVFDPEAEDSSTVGQMAYGCGIKAAYFYGKQGSEVLPYAGVDGLFGWVNQFTGNVTLNYSGPIISPFVGFIWMLNDKIGMDFGIGYKFMFATQDSITSDNETIKTDDPDSYIFKAFTTHIGLAGFCF